jgi:glutathione peroxidase
MIITLLLALLGGGIYMLTSFKRANKLPGADDALNTRGRRNKNNANTARSRRSFKSQKQKARDNNALKNIPSPPIPKQDLHDSAVDKEPHATDVQTEDHYTYHVEMENAIHDDAHITNEKHNNDIHDDDDIGHHGHYDANHFDLHDHLDTEHHAPPWKKGDLHHDLHEDHLHHLDHFHDDHDFHHEYVHDGFGDDKDHMDDHLGLYDMGFTATTITGESISLDVYRGKVTLFVNVASQCGYTEANYRILQAVYDKYKSSGFEVVAFPCNDFGNQEPLQNGDIAEFARNRSVSFQMMAKIAGINSSPIFTWLRAHSSKIEGSDAPEKSQVDWNFNKFLVDKHGHVAIRYASGIDQTALEHDVYDLLMIPYEENTHVEHH